MKSMERFVIETATGLPRRVKKIIFNEDGETHVWCHDWYGHHIIGVDCEFHQEKQPKPLTEEPKFKLLSVNCKYYRSDRCVCIGKFCGQENPTN